LEEGRFEHRPLAPATAEQLATGPYRRLDPGLEPCRLGLGDHRADEGRLLLGIAADQLARSGDQARLELVVYLTVDEDPLHPDAALAGLVEGADDHAFRRVPQ